MVGQRSAPRVGVVDLGSNSTRLLVAEVRGGVVHELARVTEVTRLGEGVETSGRLGDAAIERVFGALEGFRVEMDRLGVEHAVGVATSAVREAGNGEEFRAALHERFGVDARIISGQEEGRLTFRGATSARTVIGDAQSEVESGEARCGVESDQKSPVLVVDIGGGSTELVIGRPDRSPHFDVSIRAGSVRQTERHLPEDPPEEEALAALSTDVRHTVEGAIPAELLHGVGDGIAVAGTATSLAAVEQELEPYDPSRVDGYRLSFTACQSLLAAMAKLPLEERRDLPGLHPGRAPTIVAGAAILVEVLRAFDLQGVRVSEADLLHGAALEAAASWSKAQVAPRTVTTSAQ